MKKAMVWINLAVIFSTLFCWLCINNLPEKYQSYISGLGIFVYFGGPFIINLFLLRKTTLPTKTMANVSLALLSLLALVDVLSQIFIYMDQYASEVIKGIAGIKCAWVYFFIFLPLWIAYLIILVILKIKRNVFYLR